MFLDVALIWCDAAVALPVPAGMIDPDQRPGRPGAGRVCLWAWLRRRLKPRPPKSLPAEPTEPAVEKRIAIFVPLWHEHAVIAGHGGAQRRRHQLRQLSFLYRRLSERRAHARRRSRSGSPLPARPSGRLPARWTHLQSRLPQLDLPAHAAVRGASRHALSTSS